MDTLCVRLAALFAALLCGYSSSVAQVTAFDIGLPESHYIYCQDDGVSWELYPAFPFGPFPPGSIVFASVERGGCADIPEVDGVCIEAFVASFSDGGCGCNGTLVTPTDLKLHYDVSTLEAAGVDEASLKLLIYARIGPGWAEVPGSSVDLTAHAMRAQEAGFIVGERLYAIVGESPTSVQSDTWSAVKSLWR